MPSIPKENLDFFDPAQRQLLEPIIEHVEVVSGQRLPPIAELPPGASLGDVIQKVNEWLRRAQGQG